MKNYRRCLFILLTQCLNFGMCMDYDGWLNVRVEHSLNCQQNRFCPRGSITMKSLRTGNSIIEQSPLKSEDVKELKLLAQEDGFYTLRFLVNSGENKETDFLSSVKAQAYLDSGLSEIINAWMLPTGSVVAINVQATNSSQTGSYGRLTAEAEQHPINSKFYLHHIEYAPVPDTASYIQKLEREREAREKGDVKDNRSFLAKYWMYIVPVAIFMMISGATNPEGAAPGR